MDELLNAGGIEMGLIFDTHGLDVQGPGGKFRPNVVVAFAEGVSGGSNCDDLVVALPM